MLDEERPDVVHLHAFTHAVSPRLAREAKQRGIPVVFSYHTPTVSCQRGTLMRWGKSSCNGRLDLDLCTRCTLQGLGLPRVLANAVGKLPVGVGETLGIMHRSGKAWTALRMRQLIALRHDGFRAMMEEVDHIVAVRGWVRELLLRNGIDPTKITVSTQGLPDSALNADPGRDLIPATIEPLRIAFLGRLDPGKGPDLIVRAVRLLPQTNMELHLYGISQGREGDVYLQQLKKMAEGDSRISFLPSVPNGQVVALLSEYHILVVPSRWMETGPLVVLEAFASGVPVVGSDLGGIADLVQHEVNGLLVQPDSVEEWAYVLHRLALDRDLLTRLRSGIRQPRSMQSVAEEMVGIYSTLVRNIAEYDKSPGSLRQNNMGMSA